MKKVDEITIELGTELKLNIHITPIGDLTINDYDYDTEVYCSPRKKVLFHKNDTILVDDENFRVCVDSAELGIGTITCRVTAYIPDGDFPDGLRTEVVAIATNIVVVKTA